METVDSSRPSLPPKPQLAAIPQPCTQWWCQISEVSLRPISPETGHLNQVTYQSMPTVITNNLMTLHTIDDVTPHTTVQILEQNSILLDPDSPLATRPVPKPRLQRSPQIPYRGHSPANDKEADIDSSVLISANQSPISVGARESHPGPACQLSSCPCVCHHGNHPADGYSLFGGQVCPKVPDQSVPAEECKTHLDSRNITPHNSPSPVRPIRTPPSFPVPPRPLPKETDLVHMTTDADTSQATLSIVGPTPSPTASPTARRSAGKYKTPVYSIEAKRGVVGSSPHAIYDSLLSELHEKFNSQEMKDSDSAIKKTVKRSRSHNIIRKMSPTTCSSQRKTASLLDMFSLFLHTKQQNKTEKTLEFLSISTQQSVREGSAKSEANTDIPSEIEEDITGQLPSIATTQGSGEIQQEHEFVLSPAGTEEEVPVFSPQSEQLPSRARQRPLEALWQERSVVQQSGILSQLSKQQLLLQESMYEVVTSEQTYLENLSVAVDHFLESPRLKRVLAPRDRKSLFSSIAKIREISQSFMDAMRVELDSGLVYEICDIIYQFASGPFSAYVDYIRNMPYQEQTLHNLGKENPNIVEILGKLQEDPRCNRLPLKSFLVLPFQRVTRLKILVEAILRRTEEGSEGQATAEKALRAISKVLEACNREVGQMKQMEEMVNIANKIEFECKALPLVSSSRRLVKQGELAQVGGKGNVFGQRKPPPVHLFLFTDLLLVSTKKGPERFVVRDYVHRSLIEATVGGQVEEDLEGCEIDRVIRLALLKNHRGSMSQYLLQAPSQAERDSWMEALSQSRGQEGVYEEWDCPQVQCIEDYYGQQAGEISLRIGDTVNVLQITADGVHEGRRLVDGERGWFPSSCVVELTTEHVQRRHLRQRYRVLLAAGRMTERRSPTLNQRATSCFK